MRKLDRYIARSFLEPFLLATAFIVGLYVVADAFGHLDEYLREAGRFTEALFRMARIYVLRIPTFLRPVLPIAMLIGAAYGVAQLNARNELTAMKACGVSLWRFLAPLYVAAALVALLGMANRELLVPRVERYVASDLYAWTGETETYEHVILHLEEEDALVTMTYNIAKRHALSMTITKPSTREHISAREARPVRGGWMLYQVRAGSEETPERLWETALRRRDVELELQDPEVCRLKMLRRLIQRERASDEPDETRLRTYTLLYHARLAYPFTGLVLVGLGLPFVMSHARIQRSRMLGIGACVLICMIFYTVQFVADDLGRTGYLPAQVAAWLPSVIFGALGLYLLETVHA